MNFSVSLVAFILLFVGTVLFHSYLAKKLGARNASMIRVSVYLICSSLLFVGVVTLLAYTVFPQFLNIFSGGVSTANLSAIGSTQKLALTIGPILALLVGSVIFAYCVDLDAIKSFFTISIGSLAVVVTMLTLIPVYQSFAAPETSNQTAELSQNLNADQPLSATLPNNRKYFGRLQSKRLALQNMGQDICACENNDSCVKATYTNYRKYADKHEKSYGHDEIVNFLTDLETKVRYCAAEHYPVNPATLATATASSLEQAITQYYDNHSKWAQTYVIRKIQQIESYESGDNGHTAHVRFNYSPAQDSSKFSNGVGNRTFDYQKNDDGTFTVSAMGDANSASLEGQVLEVNASYHVLDPNVSQDPLNGFKGTKLRITPLLGEPMEGKLVEYDQHRAIILVKRRDGEISYQFDRSNVANIEAWY